MPIQKQKYLQGLTKNDTSSFQEFRNAKISNYKVKPGDIVWISPQIAYSTLYDFILDRTSPVARPEGLKKVTINAIEFIENQN